MSWRHYEKNAKKDLNSAFFYYLYQVFVQLSQWMYFPVDPLIPNVVCVLQYQRTHLRMVMVCPKVQFLKNTGIFDDVSIKVQIVKI